MHAHTCTHTHTPCKSHKYSCSESSPDGKASFAEEAWPRYRCKRSAFSEANRGQMKMHNQHHEGISTHSISISTGFCLGVRRQACVGTYAQSIGVLARQHVGQAVKKHE